MKYPQNFFALTLVLLCFGLLATACITAHTVTSSNTPIAEPKNTDPSSESAQYSSQTQNTDSVLIGVNPKEVKADSQNALLQTEVLYDFREIDKFRLPVRFAKAEERLVLDYAYGKNKSEFSTDSLSQRFNGAFTGPNANETLYLADGGDEAQKMLVVYEGTTPQYKLKFDGYEILKMTDLDEDGRNELLITTGDVYMYGRNLDAQLIRINQERIEVLKTFKNVLSSSDSEGHENTLAEATAISCVPSQAGVYPTDCRLVRYNCKGVGGSIDSKSCRAK